MGREEFGVAYAREINNERSFIMIIETKLKDLGIELPNTPTPVANYVVAQRTGNLLFFSGVLPVRDGKPCMLGKVGAELSPEEGYEAARITGLNLISQLKNQVGDLDNVKQIVKIQAFVASAPDFYGQPAVVNGVSDLMVEVFGEKGKHARTAVAVPQLPLNVPVEIEMIVEV